MITLACTKCSTTMNVDDGFAGGVCRCSNCGTIQTVPPRGASNTTGEVIFERPARGGPHRKLDALGEIPPSSGLGGSGTFSHASLSTGVPQRDACGRYKHLATLLGAAVAVLIVLLAAGWWVYGTP